VLENERKGRPSFEGITEEEIRTALDILRQNRSVATSRGGKASGEKKTAAKEAKAKGKTPSANLANILADLGD
jgi:hypothetical protein